MKNKIKKIIINIIIKNKALKFSIRYFNSILLISVSILLIYKIVLNIDIKKIIFENKNIEIKKLIFNILIRIFNIIIAFDKIEIFV